MEITGTYLWYYNICKREVWLISRGIVPDQHDENIDLGRFIHENYYKRNSKEIRFGNVVFDVIYEAKDELVIGETKKSSKFIDASKWQLAYYLSILEQANVKAKGILLYPEERKREEIELTQQVRIKLDSMIKDIEKILKQDKPPKVKKNRYCSNCGYKEYCFS
jgi:CRISPR-associated exonuclease Cas4